MIECWTYCVFLELGIFLKCRVNELGVFILCRVNTNCQGAVLVGLGVLISEITVQWPALSNYIQVK
jgi:hypothetical protein